MPVYHERQTIETLSGALRDMESEPPWRERAEEIRQLVHDLEVHRTELEMQNRELRESQSLLEESRRRYADLYDFAPVAYLTIGLDGRIVEANLTATSFLGVERANLVGRLLTAFVPDAWRTAVRSHVRICLSRNIRASTEVAVSSRRGHPIVTQMVSSPLLGVSGEVIGCRTTLTDISAVKHGQEVLSFLAQASDILSSSFDYAANIGEVTRRAVPLLADVCIADVGHASGGLQRIEIAAVDRQRQRIARAARLLRPRCDRPSALAAVLELGKPILISDYRPLATAPETAGLEHDGFVRASAPCSLMYVPMVARGETLGVFTFVASESGRHFSGADLSTAEDLARRAAMAIENARLYDDAQRAVRSREQVLSFVSHDLKNPLMGILLSTEMLLNNAPADERRRGWKQLDRIRRAVQQMRRMVEDLLDVSSIDAGRLAVRAEDHDLSSIVDETLELLMPIARDRAINLQAEVAAQARSVRCDRERIIQVLCNVVGNALKFTPRSGDVKVSAHLAGSKVLLSVQDSGRGVSPDVLPRLFERYAQADDTARGGRGLGLFISRAIVEAHGGTIWVDSAVQHGARFCFTLPLAPSARGSKLTDTMSAIERPDGSAPADPA